MATTKDATTNVECETPESKFKMLKAKYLIVYVFVMLADWLQGTNMYTLYESYGQNVATLFITGFCSSAVFGTVIGTFVDQSGRRRCCLLYCALEIIIQCLEHVNHTGVLLFGRVLGGVSTSLLFSTFESWVVAEHHKAKLPEEWLAHTFSQASTLNGFMAVIAGLIARVSFSVLGDIGPFQVALVLTIIAMVLIVVLWEENWGLGHHEQKEPENGTAAKVSTKPQPKAMPLKHVLKEMWQHPTSVYIGGSQVFFESAMFTFVFAWVPCISSLSPGNERPAIEIIFSMLMLCLAVGGALFDKGPHATRLLEVGVLHITCAILSMVALIWCSEKSYEATLLCFAIFEVCVGFFQPWASTLRSAQIPDDILASTISIFRLPLNILVMIGVFVANGYPFPIVFGFSSLLLLLSMLCVLRIWYLTPTHLKVD